MSRVCACVGEERVDERRGEERSIERCVCVCVCVCVEMRMRERVRRRRGA